MRRAAGACLCHGRTKGPKSRTEHANLLCRAGLTCSGKMPAAAVLYILAKPCPVQEETHCGRVAVRPAGNSLPATCAMRLCVWPGPLSELLAEPQAGNAVAIRALPPPPPSATKLWCEQQSMFLVFCPSRGLESPDRTVVRVYCTELCWLRSRPALPAGGWNSQSLAKLRMPSSA